MYSLQKCLKLIQSVYIIRKKLHSCKCACTLQGHTCTRTHTYTHKLIES